MAGLPVERAYDAACEVLAKLGKTAAAMNGGCSPDRSGWIRGLSYGIRRRTRALTGDMLKRAITYLQVHGPRRTALWDGV